LLDVRGASTPVCEDSSQKCCHRSRQIEKNETAHGNESKLCSSLVREGYKCVPHDDCNAILGKRTNGFDYYYDDSDETPVCEDSSQTCCHEDQLAKSTNHQNQITTENEDYYNYNEEVILCSTVARDGYSCVPSNQCVGLLDVREARKLVCEDSSQICCHKSKHVQENEIDYESETKLSEKSKNFFFQFLPHLYQQTVHNELNCILLTKCTSVMSLVLAKNADENAIDMTRVELFDYLRKITCGYQGSETMVHCPPM